MKKTYISPNTTAINIQTQQLVALSVQDGTANKDLDALSREMDDIWDAWDVWEEEDKTRR